METEPFNNNRLKIAYLKDLLKKVRDPETKASINKQITELRKTKS